MRGASTREHRRRLFSGVAFAAAGLISGTFAQSASAQAAIKIAAPTAAEVATAKQMNCSVTVVQQMEAVAADKANRSSAQKKIASHLIYAARMAQGQSAVPGVALLRTGVTIDPNGTAKVIIRTTGVTDSLLQAIRAAGGSVIAAYPQTKGVFANLPLQNLESVASRSDVLTIQPPSRPRLGNPKRPVQRSFAPYVDANAALPARPKAHVPSVIAGPLAPFGPRDASLALLPAIVNQTGSVDSEGDTVHSAIQARATYGMSGSGVKIGVMSDDVLFLQNSEQTRDIPTTVTIVDDGFAADAAFGFTPTGEGTAMMEIVYDLAPQASVFFASAFPNQDAFAANIRKLRYTYGCDIICDDVGSPDEAYFSDDIVAQAVNEVVADGALYFSSAGNGGNNFTTSSVTWEGDFVDGGTVSIPLVGKMTVHNFGSATSPVLYNTDLIQDFGQGTLFLLAWSDPYNAAATDYDLYTTDPTGTQLIDASTDEQFGFSGPIEGVGALEGDRIYVVQNAGPARALHLEADANGVAGGSGMTFVTTGNTHGHNSTAGGYGVAAAPAAQDDFWGTVGPYPNPFTKKNTVEIFSSDGPRRIFYNVDTLTGVAAPIAPGKLTFASGGFTTRNAPTVTAADDVSTSVSGFQPFYGTSAAAPHAAAIAGLIKSLNTTIGSTKVTGSKLTQAEMFTTLTSTALDGSTPGWDPAYGYGIMMPGAEASFLVNFVPTTSIKTTISATSTKVTWSTDLPASGTIYYGTSPAALTQTVIATGNGTTSHTATVSGLNQALAYYFKIGSATPTGSVVYLDATPRALNASAAAVANMILANLQLTRTTVAGTPVIQAKITISNTGAGPANDAQITAVTLGGNNPTTALPIDLGLISSTKSATTTAYFPTLPVGTYTTFVLTGTDGTGNTFTATVRVTLP